MRRLLIPFVFALSACASAPPTWAPYTQEQLSEYKPYLQKGTASISGQAFLSKRNGETVKAAGQRVTLDPATLIGEEWWQKAGKTWQFKDLNHPAQPFLAARRETVADADGKFRFKDLPAGKYYIRTRVTWMAGYDLQGGIVGHFVQIGDGENLETIMTW